MHTIITIGRSFGSAGGHIGHAIGKKLGIPFYDNARRRKKASSPFPVSSRPAVWATWTAAT